MRRTLAALLLTAAPAWAEMPPGISHFTLENGLEAVVIEDHRAPVVVQMVWYRIGSADEAPGKSGIAHYLEHLMFKGTEKLEAGELSKTVTANGGMDNAFTSYDFTAYFQRIASDRLDLVMGMEADRMQNLRIGEDDWQAEREVVLEERAQRTDSSPAALFGEERYAAQFLNHPYGRPVIGWRDEAAALTRADALAWYDAHYAPDNAVLIVAGDVTAAEVQALAERHFGPIPPQGDIAPRARPQEPQQLSPRRMEMADPRVAQPVMTRTILAPERNAGDQKQAAALTVLAELLAGSPQTSVLGQALVLPGTALSVGASYDGLAVDRTTFGLYLVPAQDVTPEDAEAALDAALARFVEEGPDPAHLERVRTQLEASRVYRQDSAHGRAYDYGQGLTTTLTIEDVNEWPDLLAAVTAGEIQEAARSLLESTATVTGWLLPAEPVELAAVADAAAVPDATPANASPQDAATAATVPPPPTEPAEPDSPPPADPQPTPAQTTSPPTQPVPADTAEPEAQP